MLAGGIAVGDREQVRRTASALLGWTLLVLTPLAVRDRRCSPSPSRGCCSAAATPARSTLAARFLLVFAPQVVLYGIGIVLAGVLQAHRRFAAPALAPLLSSVVVAAAYLVFAALGRQPGRRRPVHAGRAGARRGDDARRGGPEPEPARAGAPAAAWACGPSLRFPVGAAPRVRRLALPGCSPSPGSSWSPSSRSGWPAAARPTARQVVYGAGLTLFLVPWAALAVPLATLGLPGAVRAGRARRRRRVRPRAGPGGRARGRRLGRGRGGAVAVAGPMARVFLSSGTDASGGRPARHDDRLRPRAGRATGWSPLLTRALYARGIWKAPTVCVRRRLAGRGRRRRRPRRGAAGRRPGRRARCGAHAGRHRRRARRCWSWWRGPRPRARWPGCPASGRRRSPRPLAGAAAGLGSSPGPRRGPGARRRGSSRPIGVGVLAGALVLVVVLAVMMGAARGPLTAALGALRAPDRQEVHRG